MEHEPVVTESISQSASEPEVEPEAGSQLPNFSRNAVYFGLLFEGSLSLVALLLGWLLKQPPWATVEFSVTGVGLGVAATMPMLVGFLLAVWQPLPPFKRIVRVFDDFGRPFFAAYTVFDLAVLSLAAGVGEELLFRGVVQGVLDRWWGPWAAVPIASALFGALHALTPTYAILATLAGAYLGSVWLFTGNLLVVIIAHGLYDFIALVYLLRVRTAS
jgi:membrane protease YdiL (CAAX protease family)